MRQHRTLAVAFALALLCSPLYAAQPGAGYVLPPGSVAVWVGRSSVLDTVPINLSATTFEARYGHKDAFGSPQGMANENFGNNEKALRNWCLAQSAAHREQWDCNPTGPLGQDTGPADQWEQWDLAFTQSQTGSAFYQQWWWAFEPGGSRETAVIVNQSNWVEHGPKWPRGVRLGLQTKPGPIQGYLKWYDVQWKPANVPDPLPPPTVGAEVEFWQSGRFVSGKVKAIRDETVVLIADAAGSRSVTYALDDEGRLWKLRGAAPQPVPTPTPTPVPVSCCPVGESCSAPCSPLPAPCPSCPPAITLPSECAPIAAVRETADVIARNVFTAQRRRQRVADCIKAIERTFAPAQ